jgi:hypothetical protein
MVSSAPVTRGRIREFARWAARTPWPLLGLGMLQADIIGALLVLGFLRFGLPPSDRLKLQDLPTTNLAIFLGYLVVSFTIGALISIKLLTPVFRWQRRDSRLIVDDPADTEQARLRALRVPGDPLFALGPVSGRGPDVGQWYLRAPDSVRVSAVNAEAAWDRITGQASVVVAVLDTGVLADHLDLAGRVREAMRPPPPAVPAAHARRWPLGARPPGTPRPARREALGAGLWNRLRTAPPL